MLGAVIIMKKVIIYQTEEGKELYRDWDASFQPAIGMNINFKETDDKLCNLMPQEKHLNYVVKDIILLLPNVLLVAVA